MLVYCVSLLLSLASLAMAIYPASRPSRSLAWAPYPLYYPPRATRPYYFPEANDYYYPQEPYYYPVYQSMLPSYYMDSQRPYYYGYDEVTEPVDEMPEDLAAREVPEQDMADKGSHYGQEMWYQEPSLAQDDPDANTRFLQNLILSQMYNDGSRYPSADYLAREEQEGDRWVYGEPVKTKPKAADKEDEDVEELRSLVRGPEKPKDRRERPEKKQRKHEDIFNAQLKSNDWNEFSSNYNHKRNSNELQTSGRKAKQASTTAAPRASSPQAAPQTQRGQKEVVLARPANPARSPNFQKFVSARTAPREPSVFDTIKKLLHMEDQLDQDEPASRLQKRSFVPSEESLVAQLGSLKKVA